MAALGLRKNISGPLLSAAVVALGFGCGFQQTTSLYSIVIPSDCAEVSGAKADAADFILLEWSGGRTRIYPDFDVPSLDLAAFATPGGGSLDDDSEFFKEAVRDEISRILCEMPTDGVSITNNKSRLPRDFTTVYFAQMGSPLGGAQIGQGEFDPCNELHDNDAIIFGDEILGLGDERPVEEWIRMFANVSAHEIGHMLGYGHVPRVIHSPAQRPFYVELMLATHTVDEMVALQRLLADATNCPEDQATANPTRRTKIATLHCALDP